MLQQRPNSIWYFRWSVPKGLRSIVGKTEVVRSLKTSDKLLASSRAAALFSYVSDMKSHLTDLEFNEIAAKVCAQPEYASTHSTSYNHDYRATDNHERLTQLALKLESKWLEQGGTAAAKSTSEGSLATLGTALTPRPPKVTLDVTEPSAQLVAPPAGAVTYLASQAYTDWETSKDWADKTKKDNDRAFELLVACIGDQDITTYTKQDLKSLVGAAMAMPKRNKAPYNKFTIQECYDLAMAGEIPDADRVALKAGKSYLKFLQGFFNAYLFKDQDKLFKSITEGIQAPVSHTRYGDFNEAEVNKLYNHFSAPDTLDWLYLLAIDTGARKGELLGLTKESFSVDPETDRLFFTIKKGKTEAAKRIVPISQRLLYLGLTPELFPLQRAGCNSADVTKLREAMSLLGMPEESIQGEKRVMHSFRHAFVTRKLNKRFELQILQRLIGHSVSGAGLTARYTHGYDVKHVLDIVDS